MNISTALGIAFIVFIVVLLTVFLIREFDDSRRQQVPIGIIVMKEKFGMDDFIRPISTFSNTLMRRLGMQFAGATDNFSTRNPGQHTIWGSYMGPSI